MGTFSLMHWIIVLGMLAVLVFVWGYPLAILCRRAGKPTAAAWIAGSIGLPFFGPLICIWWLALSSWTASPTKP
jgi:hypothetical protein